MCRIYKSRPSAFFDITDEYTAYCFDMACAYIQSKIDDGEEPDFRKNKKYSSFSDLYKDYK